MLNIVIKFLVDTKPDLYFNFGLNILYTTLLLTYIFIELT